MSSLIIATTSAAAAAAAATLEDAGFTRLRAFLAKLDVLEVNKEGNINATAAAIEEEEDVINFGDARPRKRKRMLNSVSKGHPIINAPKHLR